MSRMEPIESSQPQSGGAVASVDEIERANRHGDDADSTPARSTESVTVRESRRRRVSVRRPAPQISIVIPQGLQVLVYVTVLALVLAMLVEIFVRR